MRRRTPQPSLRGSLFRGDTVKGIYKISRNGEVLYVGQSKNIKARWRVHRYELIHNRHGNVYLQRISNKHGLDSLAFEVIEEVKEDRCLTEREIHWINELNPPCNMVMPKDDDRWGLSDEAKRKISEARKGIRISPEVAKKIGIASRERWMNEDYRAKMSEAQERAWTDERRVKMSQWASGRRHTDAEKRKISAMNKGRKMMPEQVERGQRSRIETIRSRRPSREQMICDAKIAGTYKGLAEMYGIGMNTARRWLEDYGLPYKKEEIARFEDAERTGL